MYDARIKCWSEVYDHHYLIKVAGPKSLKLCDIRKKQEETLPDTDSNHTPLCNNK